MSTEINVSVEESTEINTTAGETVDVQVTDPSGYTQEQIDDMVADLVEGGDKLSWTYKNGTLTIDTSALDNNEVEDQIVAILTEGNAIGLSHDQDNETLTVAVDESAISHDNLSDVSEADHRTEGQVQGIVNSMTIDGGDAKSTY